MEREFTEWTNSWWDDANHPRKRRWLLIGDSVHREYRGALQNMCKPLNISIDFYASSFHIEDDAFRREIKHFLSYEEYEHEIIFVGWGGHHGYARRTIDDGAVYKSYRDIYESLLCYVMKYCRQTVIVTSTPVTVNGHPDTFDKKINEEVIVRNQISKDLSEKYGLLYVDHYTFVMGHLDELKYRDHKHFVNPKGSQMLAKVLFDSLVSGNIILADGTLKEEGKKRGNFVGSLVSTARTLPDIMWHQRYHDIVTEIGWIQKKAIPSSSMGLGIQCNFLYPLCRILEEERPRRILEFEFDEATKVVAQYAAAYQSSHFVLAYDRARVEHLMHCWKISWNRTEIHGSVLLECRIEGKRGIVYSNFENNVNGKTFDLILLKCPFGGGQSYTYGVASQVA